MSGRILILKRRRPLPLAILPALGIVLSSQVSTADVLIRQKSTSGGQLK